MLQLSFSYPNLVSCILNLLCLAMTSEMLLLWISVEPEGVQGGIAVHTSFMGKSAFQTKKKRLEFVANVLTIHLSFLFFCF